MRTGRNAMQERLGLGAALSRLFRLMSPRRRAQLLFFLVLMLLGALAEVAAVASVVPFLALLARVAELDRVGWVYDLLRWLGADSYAEQIRVSALLFMLTAVIAGVLRILLEVWRQRFILGLGHDNAVEVHRRILLQPYGFHLGRNSSEMLSAQEQVEVLFGTILLSLMQGAVAAVIAGLILVALISIDPFTATVAVLAFALIYGLVWSVAGPRLARNSRILGSAYAARLQTLQESLGGIRDIIIDQSHGVYLDAFRTIDRQFVGARASTAIIASAPRHIIEAAGMILIAGIAILIVEREGGLAPALPILGAVALGALRLVPFMQQMYHGWSILSGNQSALVEVLRLLQLPLPPEDASAGGGKPLPCRSDIRFDKVSFAYETQRRPAIKDVSFIIPAGSRAALVGRSGSGKSTVADLLMGLLEPTGGEIRIDGSVLSAAGRQRWRRSIGHVPQAIFLADTAIAQNIAFGVDPAAIDMNRVYEAARLAQLDEFVSELPDGFATRVGEDGIQLSGGQRQRIGIARALYKRPSVLILDEATSALDESTEAEVMQGLDALLGEKVTIIIITHRRSAMQGCELVIRLEAGEVVEGAADALAQEGPRAI